MLHKMLKLLRILGEFLRNIIGIIQKPHATYLHLEKKRDLKQIILIWILVFFSLLWSTAVKHGVFKHPLFFAVNFGFYFIISVISFLLVSLLIYYLGKIFGAKGNFRAIFLLWGFSYLPTLIWFLFISLIFLIFPPPRSYSFAGYVLSAFSICFSIALFYWKLLLYYLTLRIGFKITWGKIIKISAVFFPVVGIYSYLLYKLGIFKVPFL